MLCMVMRIFCRECEYVIRERECLIGNTNALEFKVGSIRNYKVGVKSEEKKWDMV